MLVKKTRFLSLFLLQFQRARKIPAVACRQPLTFLSVTDNCMPPLSFTDGSPNSTRKATGSARLGPDSGDPNRVRVGRVRRRSRALPCPPRAQLAIGWTTLGGQSSGAHGSDSTWRKVHSRPPTLHGNLILVSVHLLRNFFFKISVVNKIISKLTL